MAPPGPRWGELTAIPGSLTGEEGAGCPSARTPTHAPSPLTRNMRLGPWQHDGLDPPMDIPYTSQWLVDAHETAPFPGGPGPQLIHAYDTIG